MSGMIKKRDSDIFPAGILTHYSFSSWVKEPLYFSIIETKLRYNKTATKKLWDLSKRTNNTLTKTILIIFLAL